MYPTADGLIKAYEAKFPQYFAGARHDMVNRLPDNPNASILEIGCGFGETGELALVQKKCATYVGVEISETAAAVARQKLTSVLVGNVESIDLPWAEPTFDGLIMSEVLEHLVDPWQLMSRLYPLLRTGAVVMASSPNISQWRVIRELIAGRWELAESGVMDRTHLRWFTPRSYRAMFESAGFMVDHVGPVTAFSARTRFINRITLGRVQHLFCTQINLVGHKD